MCFMLPAQDAPASELPRGSVAVNPVLTAPAPGISEDEFEFADTKTFACLLCSRQFKSIEQLRRHNKESDLHKARSLLLCTRYMPDSHLTLSVFFFSVFMCRSFSAVHLSPFSTTHRRITRTPTYGKSRRRRRALSRRRPSNRNTGTARPSGVSCIINPTLRSRSRICLDNENRPKGRRCLPPHPRRPWPLGRTRITSVTNY